MLRKARSARFVFCLSIGATLAPISAVGQAQSQQAQARSVAAAEATPSADMSWVASAGAGFGVPGSIQFDRGEEGTGIVGAPYSAVSTMESVTKLLDGNRIVHTQVARLFRDSQGRTRTERTSTGPRSRTPQFEYAMITIADPAKGERYMLTRHDKTATVLPSPGIGNTISPPVTPPPPGVHFSAANSSFGTVALHESGSKAIPLGEKVIDGIRAVGARVDHTIDAGVIGNERPIVVTVEEWFSPELGIVILATNRSPTGSETTYRLEQITRDEPDTSLFVVPPDYTRREIGMQSRGFQLLEHATPIELHAAPIERK